MRLDTCPQCGTRRPDELQWCRKCGLDSHKAERGDLPDDMGAAAPTVAPPRTRTAQDWHDGDQPPTHPAAEPSRVRLEVDRRWLARLSGNAMDVGCLASIGAAIGYAAGLALGGIQGSNSRDLFGSLVLMSAVTAAGGWLGARLALWLIDALADRLTCTP
jgi:hypothetical protein